MSCSGHSARIAIKVVSIDFRDRPKFGIIFTEFYEIYYFGGWVVMLAACVGNARLSSNLTEEKYELEFQTTIFYDFHY